MRRSIRARASNAALALALVSAPAIAHAQDKASAEELFQLGKTAMAKKDLAKACNYFQGSLNADFALGTLLNLAICHEESGKIASAWSEYRTLEDKARQATPPQLDRVKFAHEHAEALRPRLSRVRIVVAPEAKALGGLSVKIDGAVAQPELYEVGVPVDVGRHSITATAPEHDEWSESISVESEKQKLDVSVPALKASSKPPPPVAPPPPPPVKDEGSTRTIGYAVGGAGAAVLATGIVFGVLAIGAKSDAKCDGCIDPSPELDAAKSAYDRADTFAWVSNIAIGAGVVGLAIGTVLVLTSGSGAEKKTARLSIAPSGLAIGGTL